MKAKMGRVLIQMFMPVEILGRARSERRSRRGPEPGLGAAIRVRRLHFVSVSGVRRKVRTDDRIIIMCGDGSGEVDGLHDLRCRQRVPSHKRSRSCLDETLIDEGCDTINFCDSDRE